MEHSGLRYLEYAAGVGYGVSDMAGNVFEWTNTVSGAYRVLRGGGWTSEIAPCEVSYRGILPGSNYYGRPPFYVDCNHGFRVVGAPQSSTDPIAYWSFDNSSNPGYDDSGNGHSGTVYGATSVDGKCGKAMSFDGSDYITTNFENGITLNAITMSAWVYKTDMDDESGIICSRSGGETNVNYALSAAAT